MDLYAIKIRKTDLNLITLLNNGVTPEVERKATYFVFDATPNSEVVATIVTEREFMNNYDIKFVSPLLLRVKHEPSQ